MSARLMALLCVIGLFSAAPGCRPEPKFDESEVESFRPKLDPVEEVETIGEMREWKPATGGKSLEGELIRLEDDKAFIKRKDGHITGVPMKLLSEHDQQYVRQATGK